MPEPARDVTLADIQAAAAYLLPLRDAGEIHRTPLLSSATAARILADAHGTHLKGGRLYAKAEHLQRTGAFKIRGAAWRVARLSDAEKEAGVIAISAGNHAQAVASAARAAGIRATVVMPEAAVAAKVAACRALGAEVILHGATTSDAWVEMERVRDARGLTFLNPFDHPDTIAGQGTVGLELVEDLPDVDVVVVPIAGGGLGCGVAIAVKSLRPNARVYGIEPVLADALLRGIEAGRPVPVTPTSVADGLNAPFAGVWTIPLAKRWIDELILLEDAEILSGVRFAAERMKQVLEPAGAAALAAVLHGRVPIRDGERVAVVCSGGNVATERLGEFLAAAAPIAGL